VGALRLPDGRSGKVVLVGPRTNPKGAMLVTSDPDSGGVVTVPVQEWLDRLDPSLVVAILATQERAFGENDLPKPVVG